MTQKKRPTVALDRATYDRLRRQVLREDTTNQDVIARAITEYLDRVGAE